MKINLVIVSLVAAGLTACSSSAAPPKTTTVEKATVPGPYSVSHIDLLKTGKHLETVSCRDYTMLDESLRPQAVSYAANYGPKGKAHPTITVDDAATVVPMVVDACNARPGDHFLTAVHTAMMRRQTAH